MVEYFILAGLWIVIALVILALDAAEVRKEALAEEERIQCIDDHFTANYGNYNGKEDIQ